MHDGGGFEAALVIRETLFGFEPGHADVNARLAWIPVRVGFEQLPALGSARVEQDDVDEMVQTIVTGASQVSESASSHQGDCDLSALALAIFIENLSGRNDSEEGGD